MVSIQNQCTKTFDQYYNKNIQSSRIEVDKTVLIIPYIKNSLILDDYFKNIFG